jgi:hypothetical protein
MVVTVAGAVFVAAQEKRGGDGWPAGDLSRAGRPGFQVSGRNCRVWSRRGPVPTAATGAPIMSSSALT